MVYLSEFTDLYIYIYIKRRRGEREKNPPVKITNWYLHQIWKIEYIVQRDGKKSRENLLKKGRKRRENNGIRGRRGGWKRLNEGECRFRPMARGCFAIRFPSKKEFWARIHPRLLIEHERRLSTRQRKREEKKRNIDKQDLATGVKT